MNKFGILFVMVSGVLFMTILVIRPYEHNYNIDEEDGIKNIISKIEYLVGDNPVYDISITSQPEQKDMDFLTLYVIDTKSGTHKEIKFNRSGAFFNSSDTKELSWRGGSSYKSFEISSLSNSMVLIDSCKKLIPEGYRYRHTEYISTNDNQITSMKIAVAPQNENDIQKNKYVRLETYSKESFSGGRRRAKSKTTMHEYYTMKFNIDKDGRITQH